MADPFLTPGQSETPSLPIAPEAPASSESLGELRQSVEKRRELQDLKRELILTGVAVGTAAALGYILSDNKKKPEETDDAEQTAPSAEPASPESTKPEKGMEVTSIQPPEAKPVVEEKPEVDLTPYRPGTNPPHVTDKSTFRAQVEQIYAQDATVFTVNNLREHFGQNYKKFLIKEDPVLEPAGQPITFLGRPISGGINMMMLPFLKIAERKIQDLNLNYIPASNEIRGFQDRNMCVANPSGGLMDDPKIPSFHKYGLAVDIDPDSNWPKNGRGNIPDEVIVAMAEAGFACGNIADPSFFYLMNDTMHYQMRFPPDSPAGQKIIEASPIGTKYWNAVRPLLQRVSKTA